MRLLRPRAQPLFTSVNPQGKTEYAFRKLGFAHNPNDNGLADDPAVAALLQYGQGQAVQLEGQMEIVHQDFKDGHGRFLFTLKQVDGTRVPLKFGKHPPTHLLSGDHVRANGRLCLSDVQHD